VVDVTEILIYWHAGRSQSQIATSLGLDRKMVKKYVDPRDCRWDRAGWAAAVAGAVGGSGARVVPSDGRYPFAAEHVARD
jgi:hypothetical protein